MSPVPHLPDVTLPDEDDEGGIKMSPEVWNRLKATIYVLHSYISMNITKCGIVQPKNPPSAKPVFDGQVQ